MNGAGGIEFNNHQAAVHAKQISKVTRFFSNVSMKVTGAHSDSDVHTQETLDTSMESKPVSEPKSGSIIAGYTVITKSMIGAGMFLADRFSYCLFRNVLHGLWLQGLWYIPWYHPPRARRGDHMAFFESAIISRSGFQGE